MPSADDRIRDALERAALPGAAPSDVTDRIASKRRRRRVARRAQVAALVVVVLAGTAAGAFALAHAFRFGRGRDRPAGLPPAQNGRIAFVGDHAGVDAIYSMEPDGSDVTLLYSDPPNDVSHPAWSPDGSRIAFLTGQNSGANGCCRTVYVMDADGTGVLALTEGVRVADTGISWSPDGSEIAYVAIRDGATALHAVGCCSELERDIRVIDDGLAVYTSPAWSPDGSKIYFVGTEPNACPPTVIGCPFRLPALFSVSADGSARTVIHTSFGEVRDPAWSRDGTRIAYAASGQVIVVSAPDGSNAASFAVNARPAAGLRVVGPAWSPDGRFVVYTVIGDQPGISIVPSNFSGVWHILQPLARAEQPSWQPVPSGIPPPAVDASEMPQPTPSISPLPSPSMSSLPAACDASRAFGDFDGDGQLDAATISRMDCLVPPEDRVANDLLDVALYAIEVRSPADDPAGARVWGLPECGDVCRALAAHDIDADGDDEFALVTAAFGSLQFVRFYELPSTEAGPRVLALQGEGATGHPSGEPLVVELGGTATHQAFISCSESDAGTKLLVSTTGSLSSDRTTWDVVSHRFAYGGGGLTLFDTQRFEYPASDQDPPIPVEGEPCFTST